MSSQPRRSQTFVVRLWAEQLGEGGVEWRGEIQQVPGGRTVYFRRLEAVPGLFERLIRDAEAG